MRLRISIACLTLLAGSGLGQTPPDKSAVKATGWRVSAEGGEEGTITYHYDEQGRPIKGTPTRPGGVPSRAGETAARAPSGEVADIAVAPAPGRSVGLRTTDGRPLPFQLSGSNGPKTVDETVDADSALRKLTQPSDLLERRYEAGQVDLTLDERFATSGNTLTLDRWQGRASPLGGQRATIEVADSLGAEVKPKHLVEVKAVERVTSPWARRLAQPAGWDDRLGGSAALGDRRVNRDEISTMGTRANAFPRNPASLDQLSMQDINRYQFRRARSTEPGLPVGKPGTDSVERTR